MDDTLHKKSDAKSTGHRYASVDEMLRSEGATETADAVRVLAAETRVTRALAALRCKAGLTQEQLGEKMTPQRTQGAISKLESGKDEELTLAEIREYSKVLNERIGMVFGPPLNHVEAIKGHALEMKRHMLCLAKLAHQDEQMEKEIQGFFGDAFFSILTLLATCQGQMPNKGAIEFKMELIEPASLSKALKKEPQKPAVFV